MISILNDVAGLRTHDATWTKCIFVRPRSHAAGPAAVLPPQRWEKVTAQPVMLARAPAVKLILDSSSRQVTETVGIDAWPARVDALMADGPRNIHLLARERDWHARLSKGGRWLIGRGKLNGALAASTAVAVRPHDDIHHHPLPDSDPRVQALFMATGLFGRNGELRGQARDKYRQVQHYLELLRPLAAWDAAGEAARPLRVVDAGCGKAYLSLALSVYGEIRGIAVELTGIDQNAELITSIAETARRLSFDRATFRAETIGAFAEKQRALAAEAPIDILVSLHACDTATDEAIAAGVQLGARAIVVAPCCQHEVVAQIGERERAGAGNAAWSALTGPGLFRHRLADLITDGLRAAALEACGYGVDVIEFISPEHTARNVMLRAQLRPPGEGRTRSIAAGRAQYAALAAQWRLEPAIGRLLGDRLTAD